MTTPRFPIASGFDASSTSADVIKGIDLIRKKAVVTGGYSGIDLETVKVLRGAGAKIFVPARDLSKARAALVEVPDVTVEPIDLLDPASIDAFADRVAAATPSLDFLQRRDISPIFF